MNILIFPQPKWNVSKAQTTLTILTGTFFLFCRAGTSPALSVDGVWGSLWSVLRHEGFWPLTPLSYLAPLHFRAQTLPPPSRTAVWFIQQLLLWTGFVTPSQSVFGEGWGPSAWANTRSCCSIRRVTLTHAHSFAGGTEASPIWPRSSAKRQKDSDFSLIRSCCDSVLQRNDLWSELCVFNPSSPTAGILKSGPLLQSLALTLIKHTWAC